MPIDVVAYDHRGKICEELTDILRQDDYTRRIAIDCLFGRQEEVLDDGYVKMCCHCWNQLSRRSTVCASCERLHHTFGAGEKAGLGTGKLLPTAMVVGYLYRYFPDAEVQRACGNFTWLTNETSVHDMIEQNTKSYERMWQVQKLDRKLTLIILEYCKIPVDDTIFIWSSEFLNHIFSWDQVFGKSLENVVAPTRTVEEKIDFDDSANEFHVMESNNFEMGSGIIGDNDRMSFLRGHDNVHDMKDSDDDDHCPIGEVHLFSSHTSPKPPSTRESSQYMSLKEVSLRQHPRESPQCRSPSKKIRVLDGAPPEKMFDNPRQGKQFDIFVNDMVVNGCYAFKHPSHSEFYQRFVHEDFLLLFDTSAMTPYEVIIEMLLTREFMTFIKAIVPPTSCTTLEKAFTYVNTQLLYFVKYPGNLGGDRTQNQNISENFFLSNF